MEFFESQDRARRNSLVLFGLFSLAVIAIVVAVTAVVYGLYWGFLDGDPFHWGLASGARGSDYHGSCGPGDPGGNPASFY